MHMISVFRTFILTKDVGDHSTGLGRQWGCVLFGLCLKLSLDNFGCQMGVSSKLFEAIEAGKLGVKVLDGTCVRVLAYPKRYRSSISK